MTKKKLLILSVLIATFSCTSPTKEPVVQAGTYYDLVGLLDHQVKYLYVQNASLEKTIGAGDESEVLQVSPDTTTWREEFKLFYNADINKLGLSDAYEVEQLSRIDGGRKLINAAKSGAQPVRLIEYNFSNNALESLRILVEEKNEVYVFKKEMQMHFAQVEGAPVLKEYSIEGTQTMVMKSDLNFSLNGKVVLNP